MCVCAPADPTPFQPAAYRCITSQMDVLAAGQTRGASGACGCVLPTQVTNLTASGHRSSTDCTAASTDNHPHHQPLSGGLG